MLTRFQHTSWEAAHKPWVLITGIPKVSKIFAVWLHCLWSGLHSGMVVLVLKIVLAPLYALARKPEYQKKCRTLLTLLCAYVRDNTAVHHCLLLQKFCWAFSCICSSLSPGTIIVKMDLGCFLPSTKSFKKTNIQYSEDRPVDTRNWKTPS